MKRSLLSFTALLLALSISSFTAKFNTVYYLVYNSGAHNAMSSYSYPTDFYQFPEIGDDVLAWISIESVDNEIDFFEFHAAFSALDESFWAINNLDDEYEKERTFYYDGYSGLHAVLEKKAQ